MRDIFVETSPDLFHADVTGADGFTKGILHKSPSCPCVVGILFPIFRTDLPHYSIEVGRDVWIKVKKDVRCDNCFPEDYEVLDDSTLDVPYSSC